MDRIYQDKQAPVQQQKQVQEKKKKAERADKKNKLKKAAEAAEAMMQAAMSGTGLAVSGEGLQVLAGYMGNQNMIRALAEIDEGRDKNFKLYAAKFSGDSDEGLPENRITISWPALRFVVRLNRTGRLPKRLFPLSALKEEILQG